MNITNETVIAITGATSGIGASLAVRLAKLGAKVSICGRRTDRLAEIQDTIIKEGGSCYAITTDISIEAQAESFITKTIEHFGTIDVVINNAGRGNYGAVEDTTTEQLHSMFALNVYPLWYTSRIALPIMKARGSGHIISVASVAGTVGFPFNSAYVSAKHAVVGFTASLRAELVDTNIHATVVNPAGVITEWGDVTEGAPIGALFGEGIKRSREIASKRGLELAPLSRMMSSDEVADKIIDCILNPPSGDVFTHSGTQEQAIQVQTDRGEYEKKMLPMFLGMREAYLNQ
jgi:uncharacterized protein